MENNIMPKTKKFKKLLKKMKEQYGEKEGERIAYAKAKKMGWRT